MKKAIAIMVVAVSLLGCNVEVATAKNEPTADTTFSVTCRWGNGAFMVIPGTNGVMLEEYTIEDWDNSDYGYYKFYVGSKTVRAPVQSCIITKN